MNLAKQIIKILHQKAHANNRPEQRTWAGWSNGNGTEFGVDIDNLIKHAHKNINKYEALDDLYWFAVYTAHKEGWQYAYDVLEKYHGKKLSFQQVNKLYYKHFKKS